MYNLGKKKVDREMDIKRLLKALKDIKIIKRIIFHKYQTQLMKFDKKRVLSLEENRLKNIRLHLLKKAFEEGVKS